MFTPEPWHPARPGLWRPARIDPEGLVGPTRSQAQRASVRRTSHGYYVPSWVEQSTPQRIVEASTAVQEGHVITGWAPLHWAGSRWFTGLDPSGAPLPVQVLINTHDIRKRPGLHLSGEGIGGHLRAEVDGVMMADLRAATSFLMRYASSPREAGRVLAMAAYDDLVSVEEMTDFVATQNSWTGVPRARSGILVGVENCWSPSEFDLVWVLVAVDERPMPLCNAPIFDLETGRHVATPDVFDPELGVAGEYEGLIHLERSTRDRDIRREGDLRGVGVEVVCMTARDRFEPGRFLERWADACARAARIPPSQRRWTVEPPDWWVPTLTVEQRRALTPEQRAKFLRYRA